MVVRETERLRDVVRLLLQLRENCWLRVEDLVPERTPEREEDPVVDLLAVSHTEREGVLLGVMLLGLHDWVSGERDTERVNVAEVAVGDQVYDSVAVLDLLAAVTDHVAVTRGVTVRD